MKCIHIVKRKGHLEEYDEKKVYGSCYAACSAAGLTKKECEVISETVMKGVSKHVTKKKSINSNEIFRLTTKLLKKHNKEIAFLYETHRDIS